MYRNYQYSPEQRNSGTYNVTPGLVSSSHKFKNPDEIEKELHELFNEFQDDFTQFVDTERNLCFRLDLQQQEMNELVMEKNSLIDRLKLQNSSSTYKVVVSGLSATNIEPYEPYQAVDAFVQIKADAVDLARSQIVNNSNNPFWNETFTLDISPDQQELLIIVNDRARVLTNSEIGRFVINLFELQQIKTMKKATYLVKGQHRIQTSLTFEAKFLPSNAKVVQEQLREKEEEIQAKIEQMKPSKLFLSQLLEIFRSKNHQMNGGFAANNRLGNNGYNSGNGFTHYNGGGGTSSGHTPDLNKSVNMLGLSAYYFPNIREQKFEKKALEKLDNLTSGIIDEWTKVTLALLPAITALCIFQSLYKPQYFEMTLLLIFMCLCFSGILTQTQHRFISVMLIVSWLLDIFWLLFLSRDWYDLTGPHDIDSSIKTFVIVISALSTILIKFPLIICLWRAYFQFDKFKEQVANRLKLKHIQLNKIQPLTLQSFDSNPHQFRQQLPNNYNNNSMYPHHQQQQQQQYQQQYQPNPYQATYQPQYNSYGKQHQNGIKNTAFAGAQAQYNQSSPYQQHHFQNQNDYVQG